MEDWKHHRADYPTIRDSRVEDYVIQGLHQDAWRPHYADIYLDLLKRLETPHLGFPIDRYQHSLQTATRALRDGADEEMVFVALLHDVGDAVAPDNHPEVSAAMLRPYVSDANYWLVKHHGVFQGYYYWQFLGRDRDAREIYRGHPEFERTAHFCEAWDQASFDRTYDTLPLSAFEPIVRRVMARKPHAPPV